MGKRSWRTVAGLVVASGVLAGTGVLVYQHWHGLVAAVFSPIGGLVLKVLFGSKVLKFVVAFGFAATAGMVALRKKLRRSPEPELAAAAPPVYGPPEREAGTEAP